MDKYTARQIIRQIGEVLESLPSTAWDLAARLHPYNPGNRRPLCTLHTNRI